MHKIIVMPLTTLILLAVGCAKVQEPVSLEFRLADTQLSAGLTEMVYSGWGQKDTFFVHRDVLISEDDVDNASVTTQNGFPAVALTFTDAGTVKFARVTGANIGRHLAMIVDGRLLSAPMIRDTIRAGKAVITGDLSEEEAHSIAEALNVN